MFSALAAFRKTIAVFLCTQATKQRLPEVMERCGYSNIQGMDKIRKLEFVRSWHLFTCSGKSGKWRGVLPMESRNLIESSWESEMRHMGYLQ